MDFLPINLRLRNQSVLLVGAGVVATRKARFLLDAGALLKVVAPERSADFIALQSKFDSQVDWEKRRFQAADLVNVVLVIAATPDRSVNESVYAEATKRAIPVNVVDSPDLCSFIFPAIVDRSPLTVAIGSEGASPVLARSIRSRIEAMLPQATADIAEFARVHRDRVRDRIPDETVRRRVWESIIDGPIAQLILSNRWQEAELELERQLDEVDSESLGEVYLIGAGPGDPELLTFRALRLLQRADVVLHDRLVNPEIVAMARRDARKIYVGKKRSEHSVPQDLINQTLVDLAREGKYVARLKGGDPFIFGRGGEEIELLAKEGIAFQVVPGITAASGAASYVGIPLTHREHAQSVRFVTGHTKNGQLEHRWDEFTNESETLVFYMGLVGLPIICEQLLKHGRAADTPVALIERASLPDQRLITGTLSNIKKVVEDADPQPPTLIIVGSVVSLAGKLRWYGSG